MYGIPITNSRFYLKNRYIAVPYPELWLLWFSHAKLSTVIMLIAFVKYGELPNGWWGTPIKEDFLKCVPDNAVRDWNTGLVVTKAPFVNFSVTRNLI